MKIHVSKMFYLWRCHAVVWLVLVPRQANISALKCQLLNVHIIFHQVAFSDWRWRLAHLNSLVHQCFIFIHQLFIWTFFAIFCCVWGNRMCDCMFVTAVVWRMMVSVSCHHLAAGHTHHVLSCHMDRRQTTLTALVRCQDSLLRVVLVLSCYLGSVNVLGLDVSVTVLGGKLSWVSECQ